MFETISEEKTSSAPVLGQEATSESFWTWLQWNILHGAPFKFIGVDHHILILKHDSIFLCPMNEPLFQYGSEADWV